MKKTFQKELKTTTGKVNQDNQFNGGNGTASSDSDNLNPLNPNETSHLEQKISSDFAGASTSLNAFSSPKRTAPILNHSPISIESGDIDVRLSNIVDLEYLKHVIFKFLTSKEYEVSINSVISVIINAKKKDTRRLSSNLFIIHYSF